MSWWLILAVLGAAPLAIAWAGYPIGVAWRARLALRPAAAQANAPDLVSVVIATRASPTEVRDRIEDILTGRWPRERLDIVVAVDNPENFDAYTKELLPLDAVRCVHHAGARGKAAALNTAVAKARGTVFVFTDSAQRFAPDAIPALVQALTAGPWRITSGALAIGNESDQHSLLAGYWRRERKLREQEALVHSTIGVTGSIYAMHRQDWSDLPEGLILDDLWVPMTLVLNGHRVGFTPAAQATDVRITTPEQEYRRKVRTLTGVLQLVAWRPALLSPWHNPVWFQFWCHKLLRLTTPLGLLLFGIGATGAVIAAWGGTGATAILALAATPVAASLVPGTIGRRARRLLHWGVTMNLAILTALWHGLRGDWEVWQ